jgi:hypothetical protein
LRAPGTHEIARDDIPGTALVATFIVGSAAGIAVDMAAEKALTGLFKL